MVLKTTNNMSNCLLISDQKIIREEKIKIFGHEIDNSNFIDTSKSELHDVFEKQKFKSFVSSIEHQSDNDTGNETKKQNAIFINAEAKINGSNRSDLKGIELIFWLRLKYNYTGPIVVYGFLSSAQILRLKPRYIVIHSPGNMYWRLGDKWEKGILNNDGLEKTKIDNLYYEFVYPVFDFKQYAHSFANSYGFHLMYNVHKEFNPNFTIDEIEKSVNTQFLVADFLFKKAIGKKQKERAKSSLKKLKETQNKTVVHIEDESKWYKLFKDFFDPSVNYTPIETNSDSKYDKLSLKLIIDQIIINDIAPWFDIG